LAHDFAMASLRIGDVTLGPWAVWTLVVIAVGAVVGLAASLRAEKTPIVLILAVALGLRIAVAVLSRGHTPADIGVATQHITAEIHQRRDPLTVLPRYRWNFLPFMPTVYALLDHLGLPWQYTVKIPAIAADLVTTVLVGSFAPDRKRAVQWLYATNPICLFVTSVHGQVEPTALMFGLGALLLVRRSPAGAGLLLGFAVSAKTWPVIFLPGLLWAVPWRAWWRVVVGTVVAPVLFVFEGLFLLHDHLHDIITRIVGYRSFIGTWGWTGILHFYNRAGSGYAGAKIDHYQQLGTVLLVCAAIAVLITLRHHVAPHVVLGLMFVFYAVTAGFGVQYLMWAVPLALTQVRRAAVPYLVLASIYCAVVYLWVLPTTGHDHFKLGLQAFGSIPVIVAAVLGLTALIRARLSRAEAVSPSV
jgi:hypothetical protein